MIKNCIIIRVAIRGIFFYNFTTPEFNVSVCQLLWALTVFYAWKIFCNKKIEFLDAVMLGVFAAAGVLSKYLFIYLLISIDILFFYLIFIKKDRKFDFKYLISLEVFLVLLVPHIIWLINNDYITKHGINRTGLEKSLIIDHLRFPVEFILKQVDIVAKLF